MPRSGADVDREAVMSRQPNKNLMARVTRAAAAVLARDRCLSYPSLLIELGVLTRKDLDAWRARATSPFWSASCTRI